MKKLIQYMNTVMILMGNNDILLSKDIEDNITDDVKYEYEIGGYFYPTSGAFHKYPLP